MSAHYWAELDRAKADKLLGAGRVTGLSLRGVVQMRPKAKGAATLQVDLARLSDDDFQAMNEAIGEWT